MVKNLKVFCKVTRLGNYGKQLSYSRTSSYDFNLFHVSIVCQKVCSITFFGLKKLNWFQHTMVQTPDFLEMTIYVNILNYFTDFYFMILYYTICSVILMLYYMLY